MYETLLFMHSWLRWIVLIAGLVAAARAVMALTAKRAWVDDDRKVQLGFVIALDLQFVLGLILYFVSPMVHFDMKNRLFRYFAVEHVFMMVAAIAVVHVFSAKSRKAADAVRRMKLWAYGALIGLALLLAGIPWPMFSFGRPLLRLP